MAFERCRRLLQEEGLALLTLGAGLVAGLVVYLYLSAFVRLVPVVVTATGIEAGSRLDAASLRLIHLPRAAVHPQALSALDDARGRVARFPLLAGEQVLAPRLSGGGGRGAVEPLLASGQRAMYLPLPPESGYPPDLIQAGQRVDVVFVPENGDGDAARLFLAGVPVLSVKATRSGLFGGEEGIQGLVVAVDVPEAEALASALARGRLHLLLAGPEAGALSGEGGSPDAQP